MKVTDPRFQLERIRKYIDEDIFLPESGRPIMMILRGRISGWGIAGAVMTE